MLDQIRILYQEIILDHGRNPRNFRQIDHASCENEGFNPLCGDQVTLYIKENDRGILEDISFKGAGCAISLASASLLCESLKGKSRAHALELFDIFHSMLVNESIDDNFFKLNEEKLGKLKVMAGVREFPMRIKCANMAWHGLKQCLSDINKGKNIS